MPSMPTVMSNNNACSRPDASMPTAPPGTVIPQRPVLSMPVTTSRVPLATKLFGEPPFYHKKAMPSTAQHPAAALDLRTGPASDVPHASLAQIAVNNARTMSLRRFLHWVISQPEIHTLQSINHAQAKDTEKSTTRAIHVLRNLVVLEEMYRPGRVMLPTQELYHIVQVIHTELEHMRRLTEDTVEQIHGNSRSMDATEFVTWLSYHFTVCERRFKIPKASFLYDPDSLTCQQHLVDKALEFYRQPDILHDRTLTNALIDIIVRALMGYYNEAYRSNGKYKPLAQIRAERKAARENSAKSSPGADRLLFQHDAPR